MVPASMGIDSLLRLDRRLSRLRRVITTWWTCPDFGSAAELGVLELEDVGQGTVFASDSVNPARHDQTQANS